MTSADILAEHQLTDALRPSDLANFRAEGVSMTALTRSATDTLSIVTRAQVVLDGQRFEFARHLRDPVGALGAYIIPLTDTFGEASDFLGWRPGHPPAVWLGRVAVAGMEHLFAPRIDGCALDVHRTVLDWLRADRHGVVVIDHARAAVDLRIAAPLRVADREHAKQLRVALTTPAPRILVADEAEVTA